MGEAIPSQWQQRRRINDEPGLREQATRPRRGAHGPPGRRPALRAGLLAARRGLALTPPARRALGPPSLHAHSAAPGVTHTPPSTHARAAALTRSPESLHGAGRGGAARRGAGALGKCSLGPSASWGGRAPELRSLLCRRRRPPGARSPLRSRGGRAGPTPRGRYREDRGARGSARS